MPQRGLLLRSELVRAGEDAEAWPTLAAARRHADALDEQQRRQRQEEEEAAGRGAIAGVSAEQEAAMAGLLLQGAAVGGGAEEGAISTAEGAVVGAGAGVAEGEGAGEGAGGGGGETLEGGQRARTACELRALHLLTPWAEVQKPEDAGTPTPLCSALGACEPPPTPTVTLWYGCLLGTCVLQPLAHMAAGARGRLHCAACCVWRSRELFSKAARSKWARLHSAQCSHPPFVRRNQLLAQGCPLGPRGEPERRAMRICPQVYRLDAHVRLRRPPWCLGLKAANSTAFPPPGKTQRREYRGAGPTRRFTGRCADCLRSGRPMRKDDELASASDPAAASAAVAVAAAAAAAAEAAAEAVAGAAAALASRAPATAAGGSGAEAAGASEAPDEDDGASLAAAEAAEAATAAAVAALAEAAEAATAAAVAALAEAAERAALAAREGEERTYKLAKIASELLLMDEDRPELATQVARRALEHAGRGAV